MGNRLRLLAVLVVCLLFTPLADSADTGATVIPATKEFLDLALEPPVINTNPGAEYADGRLWMLARTHDGVIAESYSNDDGRTWAAPQASTIKNLSARFFIRRLGSGRLLLVKNGGIDQRLPKRSQLTAFLSDDDGRTWLGGLTIDERAQVSYPDGFQAPDGMIHIIHDYNRGTDAEILLAKFREEDVLSGKFTSPGAQRGMLVNKARGPKKTAGVGKKDSKK